MLNMSYPNFLIGAGASTAFGFPSMKELTREFAQHLLQEDKTKLNELYNGIVNIMNSAFENNADVESIMSVIVGLKENSRFKENIGDFGLYVLYSKFHSNDMFSNLNHFNRDELEQLETEYKQFIRSKLELNIPIIEKAFAIYDNLFGNLYRYYGKGDPFKKAEPYSKIDSSYHNMHNHFNIFTTNYDTAVEKYFNAKLKDFTYYTGATNDIYKEKKLDMDDFVRKCFSTQEQSTIRIIKLHGSINWIKDKDGNLIQKDLHDTYQTIKNSNESDYIKEEIMIYPLSQKQLYLSPFIQFFNYLEKELRSNKIWIVIGYSFRDIFIRNMFERSIDTVKKIIIVSPHSDEVKGLFNSQTQNKIIEIKKRFGIDEECDNVNENIEQELKKSVYPG